jgi:hypothetical protein
MGILWEAFKEGREYRKKMRDTMQRFDRRDMSSRDERLQIAKQWREARKKYTDAGLFLKRG